MYKKYFKYRYGIECPIFLNVYLRQALLIMKLMVFLLTATVMHVSGAAFGQKKITLSESNTPFFSVVKKLTSIAEIDFIISNETLERSKNVDIRVKDAELDEVLAELFKNQPFEYVLKSNTVIVKLPTERLGLLVSGIEKQQYVTGKVVNGNGEPLPGASIQVKETNRTVPADEEGSFSIAVVRGDVLVITFMGYQTQEQVISSFSPLQIVLEEVAVELEELAISVGYGKARRSDVTGSIASVSGSDLESSILTSPDRALQGRAAGVSVRTSSHAPGGGISVNVRGTSSITASGQPLYVVDGFPVTNNFYRPNNVNEGGDAEGNPLAAIDASNIESIEVLKDASATAIYGSRGANGVVIITTKRGKQGKAKVDVAAVAGIRKVSKIYELLTGSEAAALRNEDESYNNRPPLFTQEEVNAIGKGTDWQKEVFRLAPNQRYHINVSGGTDEIRYLLNAAYDDQEGIILGSGFRKFATNINLDAAVSPKLKVGTSLNVANTAEQQLRNDTKGSGNWPSMVMNIFLAPSYIPARNPDGTLTVFSDFKGGTGEENPLFMAENYDINSNTVRLLGSLFADYEITKALTFRTRFGMDYRDWRHRYYYPIQSRSASATQGEAGQFSDRTANILNENLLEYENAFNDRHKLNVLVGMTYQRENSEYVSASAFGFPADFYSYNNLGIANTPLPGQSSRTQWTLLSYLGRVNYNFRDRLLLTATARIDGSSKFGINHKYGFFPSAALAWRMSEEAFVKDLNVFSDLKLRLGYGRTGNEGIGMYKSISTIAASRRDASAYIFNNQLVTIAYPSNIPNPDLTWEKATDINMGLDMGFANNRLGATVDLYKKKTNDLLLAVPLPAESGYQLMLQNLGAMENKGIEIALQSRNFTGNFSWTTQVNIAVNRNKILNLGGADYLFTGWVGGNLHQNNGTNVVRLAPGKPVGAFYGSIAEGIWRSEEEIARVGTMPAAQPGSMRFKDTNGDGVYNAFDDTYIGDPNPDFTYGMTNSFAYKQWSLNVMLYGEYGQDVIWLTKKRMAGGFAPWAPDRRSRWTPENPDNPNATLSVRNGYPSALSTDNTYDGSFLRISNLALSYLFSQTKLRLKGITSVRLTLAADNPFLFTKYPGYDPEINSYGNSNVVKGMDKYGYPASRLYSFGIDVTF